MPYNLGGKMQTCVAQYSKAQIKIQEMAFVLVALMIFGAIGGIFFINYRINQTKSVVEDQRQTRAIEMALKLCDMPELSWSSDNKECSNCIDLDKALVLKEKTVSGAYKYFWNKDIDWIKIELLYPKKSGECTSSNYPNCAEITILNRTKEHSYEGAFVALCRYNQEKGDNFECELGRILVSAKSLNT
jgi:hypothetical protein